MTVTEMKTRMESLGPKTYAEVRDQDGDQYHFFALVVSPLFEGKSMPARHRMIYALLENEIRSGEVHALALRTLTPEQYETQKGTNS